MMKLGHTDEATDLLLFAFRDQAPGSQPAIVNFVEGYGPVVLPRLCNLVEAFNHQRGAR